MRRFTFHRLWAIVLKEFIQMRRDRVTFAMMIGIPLILLVLVAVLGGKTMQNAAKAVGLRVPVIGSLNGADPEPVRAVVANLPPFTALYLNTRTGDMVTTKAPRAIQPR